MKSVFKFLVSIFLLVFCSVSWAQSGKIIAEEHFKDNARTWEVGEDNDVVRTIEDGKLKMECKKYLVGKGGYSLKMPGVVLPATNYSISVRTRWIKNMKTDETCSPYGIIVANIYFLIYADGDRRCLRYNGFEKKYETIVDWGGSGWINHRGTADNVLEMQYKDGKAAFYCNGQMLFKKEIGISSESSLKLFIEGSEVVTFDDIIVKNI